MLWLLTVDLAAAHDFTAVSAMSFGPAHPRRYRVPHLDRWRLPYPETVAKVAALANTPPLTGAALVVDGTGVGRPVVDMLRAALPDRTVYSVVNTGGSRVTRGDGPHDLRVPKKDLIGSAQVLLGSGRLKVAPELPLADVLVNEVVAYQVKITPGLNETFENGRDAPNDDLVLSLALGCWLGEHLPGPLTRPLVLNGEEPAEEPPAWRMEALALDLELFADD